VARLDDVLIAADQASLGVHSTSLARPIPQLLLLALRLCWKPLNPLHLLEFLTHPDTPVEFHLRNELSRALVECPGIGGPKWLAAIEGVKEIYKTKPAEEAKRLIPVWKTIWRNGFMFPNTRPVPGRRDQSWQTAVNALRNGRDSKA
jgi:hypothetical protein